jgi:tRNA threonylcarbamoyladenosine biosynthesis protein TsaE
MELHFSLSEIDQAARSFWEQAGDYRVFAFHAPMGTGKTTFIAALCRAKGVSAGISSPTFSLINEYATSKGEPIYHIDLYRLRDEEEARQAGVEDCLYSGQICLVEWPEKAPGIFPENTLQVVLETHPETRYLRTFTEA